MSGFTRAELVGMIVSAVIVVVGVVIVATNSMSGADSASFGWFAYAPLANAVYSPAGIVVLNGPALLGVVLAVLGLLGVTFVVGLRLGSRSSSARS